jgi:thiamine-monophosphate kinase
MVMNISDIGAMGGYPLYAMISLGLKGNTMVGDIDSLYMGFLEELRPFNASIIGGNITRTEQKTFIDITMIGEVEREIAVRRSAAIEGDSILVTGYPGSAAAGLQMLLDCPDKNIKSHPLVSVYNKPSHRAREGRAIAKSGYVRAMIDISDGFLGDLGHICEQSGMGAEIIRDNLPICESMFGMEDRYDLVMKESDDYELIITCPHEHVEKIREAIASVSDIKVTEVGRITDASEGIVLILPDGTRIKPGSSGWDHFKG